MIARWFGFAERGTSAAVEVRAGVTTFMVMAYIIFVNPAVLGYVGVPGLEGKGLLRWKIATGGPERGSLPRRAYTVSARGMDAVRNAQRTLQRMWQGLEPLFKERP